MGGPNDSLPLLSPQGGPTASLYPTPSLEVLVHHTAGETACWSLSNKSQAQSHASLAPTPPRARHRASTWGSVNTQAMEWAESPGSPEHAPPPPPPPCPSWRLPLLHERGALPIGVPCPWNQRLLPALAPHGSPVQGLHYLVWVLGARNIIHASALDVT